MKQGTAKSKEGASLPTPTPVFYDDMGWGSGPTRWNPGANTCLPGPHFSCPYLSTAPKGASGSQVRSSCPPRPGTQVMAGLTVTS